MAAGGEQTLYLVATGAVLSAVGLLWIFYMAVEPFVRRRWPRILVSWTRLLSGDWRDPRLGRDVLIGCAAGAMDACLRDVAVLASTWTGHLHVVPFFVDWNMFNGTSTFVGALLGQLSTAIFVSLLALLQLFLFRVVVRRDWAAATLFALFSAASLAGPPSLAWPVLPFALLSGALSTAVLLRVGLVAMIAQRLVSSFFHLSPMTLNTAAWYASLGYVTFLVLLGIAIYGFRTSLAGRPVLSAASLEE